MLRNLKRLLLGIGLIVFASAVLLLSDLKQRNETTRTIPRVGLLQTASVQLLDDTVRGIVDGLAENGFIDGQTINIQKYNAQGDIALTNSIAKEMVNANFNLLMTVSTVSLQAVANANRGGKTVQVFGAVADPSVAGVGISHDKPLDHPRNLVGIGSFLPVADSFQIARQMFPGLKKVGVAWNPAEANSRAFTEKAREACKTMGIELLEANVENSNGVLEAEESLVARGRKRYGSEATSHSALPSIRLSPLDERHASQCSQSLRASSNAGHCLIMAPTSTKLVNKPANWQCEFFAAKTRRRYPSQIWSLRISSSINAR